MRAAATGALPIGTTQSFVTILICDIRRFTQLTARLGPQRTGDLLNEYLPRLIDCVHAHDGSVERLAGDGMFAVFGSPNPDPHQQEHAVAAALEMQSVSDSLMKSRAARKAETCGIGIGIDCGPALHGFIGNADRLGYAVIGDPANRASRYCSAASEGEVLISPDVHARVFNRIRAERVEFTTKDGQTLWAFRVKELT